MARVLLQPAPRSATVEVAIRKQSTRHSVGRGGEPLGWDHVVDSSAKGSGVSDRGSGWNFPVVAVLGSSRPHPAVLFFHPDIVRRLPRLAFTQAVHARLRSPHPIWLHSVIMGKCRSPVLSNHRAARIEAIIPITRLRDSFTYFRLMFATTKGGREQCTCQRTFLFN